MEQETRISIKISKAAQDLLLFLLLDRTRVRKRFVSLSSNAALKLPFSKPLLSHSNFIKI